MIGENRLEHSRANADGTPSSSNTGQGENVSAHKPKTVRIKPAEGSTPQFAMVPRCLLKAEYQTERFALGASWMGVPGIKGTTCSDTTTSPNVLATSRKRSEAT